jgi:hypothetical protein
VDKGVIVMLIGIVGKAKTGKATVIAYLSKWNMTLTAAFTLKDMHDIKAKGGVLVRINRPQPYTSQHQQHKEVDCVEALKLIDYHISNIGTRDELYKRLDALAEKLALQPIAAAALIKIEPLADEEPTVPVIEMKMTTVKVPAKKKSKKGKKK